MREQARKREGVMRVEGVKLILTALEYGWTPDIVLCAPLQAAELNKAAPQLRDDDVLLVGTAEVVSCALLQVTWRCVALCCALLCCDASVNSNSIRLWSGFTVSTAVLPSALLV